MAEENLFTPRCIRTNSGLYLNVFDPTPEMICKEDIAHALAKIPRFGGHLIVDYCVLQHQIHVAELLAGEGNEEQFSGLNHDDTEYALIDLPSPIKIEIPEYKAIEDYFASKLATILGFKYPFSEAVHEADKKMLHFEWDVFMLGKEPDPLTIPLTQKNHFAKHNEYYCLSKEDAREIWLAMFNTLKDKINNGAK